MMSALMPSFFRIERLQNHWSAILIGVVRHAEKTSAGSSALCGKSSSAPHAARRMHSRMPLPRGIAPPIVSAACRAALCRAARAADAAFRASAAAPDPETRWLAAAFTPGAAAMRGRRAPPSVGRR